ncbi:MAG: NAD(P)H-quinone oxidoreductase subunit 3 [Campylobacteraceae bacterium]|nr:NAD(P)H-quinone oxidoreductase subunit 3 [Campylobacteraceae bacterium]
MSHMDFSHPYFGAFFAMIFAFIIFALIVFAANYVGKKLSRRNDEKLKLTIYECGFPTTKQPNRISSHFYLFALLFILFDVEIIFMFPWAINFTYFKATGIGMFAFAEMILFILLLGIGFIYAWNKGALEWHNIR